MSISSCRLWNEVLFFFTDFRSLVCYFNVLKHAALSAITAKHTRSALIPSAVQRTLQLEILGLLLMQCESLLSLKEILQRPVSGSLQEALPSELFFPGSTSYILCRWAGGLVFLCIPLKQTVTLVSDAVSSDLETHWTKNVYNLFFPLDFLFFFLLIFHF